MSRRGDHLAEMRFALAERVTLTEARRRLAMLQHRARLEALEKGRAGAAISRPRPDPAPQPAQPAFWWNRD
jgi:hypothetical protein